MHFVQALTSIKLILVLSTVSMTLVGTPAALSQGMMEYGGLMAMPKGIPGGDTVKNLTKGFNAIPNAIPGRTATTIPSGATTTMPDGTVVIDPKKAKEMSQIADADYKKAKQIMANKGALTPAALKQAERFLRDAITVRNSIWGYADPTIPKLLNELAGVYQLLKQPATAKSCYQNALVYINKKYGPGSFERLDTFVNLAPLLVKEGNLSEALSLQQQITMIKERKSGAEDPGTIEARLIWAGTAKTLDKPNAPDIYKQCLTDLGKAGSKISPDNISRLRSKIIPSYVEVLKKQGREDEAKEAAGLLSNDARAQQVAPGATPGVSGGMAITPGTTPSAAAGTTPGTAAGTTPGTAAGTTPGTAAGTTPGTAAGTTPSTAVDGAFKATTAKTATTDAPAK